MATLPSEKVQDFTDRPLADYFWVAGVDGQDLLDAYEHDAADRASLNGLESPLGRAVDEIIEEDAAAESSFTNSPISPTSPTSLTYSNKHSRQSSHQKVSRVPSEARSSVQSIDKVANLSSVRSSATIRRVVSSSRQSPVPPSPGLRNVNHDVRASTVLSDADFERILKRFTNDRDAFYLDLNFKDEPTPPKSTRPISKPPRIRTQRIVAEDLEPGPSPNRTLGSVRRHMSFKDMSSHKRAPSIARRFSTRSARRVSSYNAVMPMPQPLQASADEHPLKRSFEPVLLDRYPRPEMSEEIQRREQFPDYVPMFAFPNDVNIISSDSRPATKWHEFFLTASDNSKRPCVCVVIWIPLDRRIADDLERRCEEWRRAHMPDAERELAVSLGERLAAERAKLSRLLAMLPSVESGTETREDLEDEIGEVEEKIAIMSDMLKPLRHGAANRIEGLTDGDSGLWIPRAYGIMGRDQSMVSFWKEWLKAVVVPMMDGAILRVPASSPRVGMWQPLERYVSILCTQALQPMSSRVQVEVKIRELRLYAKVEAPNELPGSRTVDLYPLFRCLTIPNIVVLFEYLLSESRIILVSTCTSMLKLASNALMALLWPLEWSGVHIPVLPTRLIEVLEAPIPYICGVVRKNDNLSLPQDDDFLMVDLDKNELHATAHPHPLPKQQRRKLTSLLYLAAPHHQTRGVPTGPPSYAYEAFPHDMFISENSAIFSPNVASTDLANLASLSSTYFGPYAASARTKLAPIFNAFVQTKPPSASATERPRTGSTAHRQSHTEGRDQNSPVVGSFPTPPQSRNESGSALHVSLKEKRSGHFDMRSKHSPSLPNIRRKASLPFIRHNASLSQVSEAHTLRGGSTYAPSTYAQSTLAASTVMLGMPYQPVQNTSTVQWQEGHCMQWRTNPTAANCSICNEKTEEGQYICADCPVQVHARCLAQICIPCRAAFCPDQVRAAFARFFTSLFYNYRRFMMPASLAQRKQGLLQKFNADAWIYSLPPDHGEYIKILKETQAFDVFVQERETHNLPLSGSVALFEALMSAKKSRTKGVRSTLAVSLSGRNPFAGRSHLGGGGGVPAEYLSDTSTHVWSVVPTPHNSERADLGHGAKGREYRQVVSRTPAKLEDELFAPATSAKPKKGGLTSVNGRKG